MASSNKVLVMGDDTRSFLATVRSLGRKGIDVQVIPFNFRSPSLKSRYISKIHYLPLYVGDGSRWLNGLIKILSEQKFSLIVPCDERAILPLVAHSAQLSSFSRLAIPDETALRVFFNKINTRALATELGVSIAKGSNLSDAKDIGSVIAELGLPLAIKPSSSYSESNLYSRGKVIIADTIEECARAIDGIDGGSYFFEQFFEGESIGLSALSREGSVSLLFQHRRVHELHGTSHYRVSEVISESLENAVRKLIAATRYTGIAMFEFRVNPRTHEWVLLEVNARPWGSLPLPVALGADFPYFWYQLLVDGSEAPLVNYRKGIYGRNVFPDLRYLIARAGELRNKPFHLVGFLGKSIFEYARILFGREVYDVLVVDDPNPARAELLVILRDFMNAIANKFGVLGKVRRRREKSLLSKAIKIAANGTTRISVVCQGNICRSPVAAAILKRELAAYPNIEVTSYGNLPREGVCSPHNAIVVAKTFGVDLNDHRSRHFDIDAATRSDVIVVFDHANYRWVTDRGLDSNASIVMLSSFSDSNKPRAEIQDPDRGSMDVFQDVYTQIHEATLALARQIRKGVARG